MKCPYCGDVLRPVKDRLVCEKCEMSETEAEWRKREANCRSLPKGDR